jgi:hypothetical protein
MPEASEISWAMLERESLLASSSIQRCPSISGQLAGETVAERRRVYVRATSGDGGQPPPT